jgi:membrane protein DedA with SNARE-associated domain
MLLETVRAAVDSGAAAASMDSTVATVTYLALFAGVALGAIVPVIPTGALVSTAAVTSLHSAHPWTAALVIAIGALGALIGDMVLFWLCSLPVGDRLLTRLRGRTSPAVLERYHRRLDDNGIGVLILSRLIPGGRIPIMVATLVLGVTWRWYLAGDSVAAVAWAVTYAAIGVLSGSLFDEQWKGIALAIALVVLVSVGPSLVRALRPRHVSLPKADSADPAAPASAPESPRT